MMTTDTPRRPVLFQGGTVLTMDDGHTVLKVADAVGALIEINARLRPPRLGKMQAPPSACVRHVMNSRAT